MKEIMELYNIEIMTVCMCLCGVGWIMLALYRSKINIIIRGLKNQVKMRDDRISEMDLQLKACEWWIEDDGGSMKCAIDNYECWMNEDKEGEGDY